AVTPLAADQASVAITGGPTVDVDGISAAPNSFKVDGGAPTTPLPADTLSVNLAALTTLDIIPSLMGALGTWTIGATLPFDFFNFETFDITGSPYDLRLRDDLSNDANIVPITGVAGQGFIDAAPDAISVQTDAVGASLIVQVGPAAGAGVHQFAGSLAQANSVAVIGSADDEVIRVVPLAAQPVSVDGGAGTDTFHYVGTPDSSPAPLPNGVYSRAGTQDVTVSNCEAALQGLIVTTTADENDGGYGGTGLSLREAVIIANALPGPDTITFAPALSGGTITLTMGEMAITDDVTITGLGAANLAVDGNASSRIFNIGAGTAACQATAAESTTPASSPSMRAPSARTWRPATVAGSGAMAP
ncbi:MAG: hypothetical protein ACYS5V_17780, partial [Planctomycetota bacterium]